jgi:hypothetical protein
MEIRGAGDRGAVVLSPNSRKLISETLKGSTILTDDETDRPNSILIKGVLRALDLDKDCPEVTVGGESKHIRGVGETVDDLIGPMVNREVNVRARPGPRDTLIFMQEE